MINVLTIAFDFDGKTYLAQAKIIKDNDGEQAYAIWIYSDGLNRIIPEGKIQYCPKKMAYTVSTHPLANKLLHCIDESVNAHLRLARLY
jgi:hypothetical protein